MQIDLSNKNKNYSDFFNGWLSLDRVQCNNLHPLFKEIEEVKYKTFYHQKMKIILVEYGYDENTGKYNKSYLSYSIPNVINEIVEYYSIK